MTALTVHLSRGGTSPGGQHPRLVRDCTSVEELLDQLHAEGDVRSRRDLYARLVDEHLHLVDAIASRYHGRGLEWDDLVQVGRLGLCKAINGYRPTKGPSFLAYAVPTITGEIKRFFRDTVWDVRPPRRLQELQLELRERQIDLTQRLGHHPSDRELATVAGVDEALLRESQLAQQMSSTVSIDIPGESGGTWAERFAAEADDYAATEARLVLRPALRALTRRERRIVHLRFVREWTQQEIGDALSLSQMQISRLLDQILTKLRRRIVPLERAS